MKKQAGKSRGTGLLLEGTEKNLAALWGSVKEGNSRPNTLRVKGKEDRGGSLSENWEKRRKRQLVDWWLRTLPRVLSDGRIFRNKHGERKIIPARGRQKGHPHLLN